MRQPNELSHISARDIKSVTLTDDQALKICQNPSVLASYGVGLDSSSIQKMAQYAMDMQASYGFDAAPQGLNPTIAGITTPVQFLQSWLPGEVFNMTSARKIDELVGITAQASWADEEIVQQVRERTGEATPYSDTGNSNQAGWNVGFERRTIVRHELGLEVGTLEEQRAAAIRVNAADAKRSGVIEGLEISRNRIGFFGYNDGANRTYGFLNDPALPAYVNVPNGANGSPRFASKDFQEIKNDFLMGASTLRTGSREVIDPSSAQITVAIATSAIDFLHQTTDFGVSVYEWISKNYPNWRIVSAPELDAANAGDSVFYMYAETVGNSGTDDTRTFVQVVPTKLQTLGVMQKTKSYEEDYSNATAGVLTKRPYAVYRASGI